MKELTVFMLLIVVGVHETIGCICIRGCIDKFYLLTATGTDVDHINSGTDGTHYLEITVNGRAGSVEVCGPGTKCTNGAVDYYTLDIRRFKFLSTCIRKQDFEGAKLKAKSEDGWYITSVYLFADTCETHELLTANPKFNKWVEGDVIAHLQQPLTKI